MVHEQQLSPAAIDIENLVKSIQRIIWLPNEMCKHDNTHYYHPFRTVILITSSQTQYNDLFIPSKLSKDTALSLAAYFGSSTCIALLLSAGADANGHVRCKLLH